jgi:hypothetical protein
MLRCTLQDLCRVSKRVKAETPPLHVSQLVSHSSGGDFLVAPAPATTSLPRLSHAQLMAKAQEWWCDAEDVIASQGVEIEGADARTLTGAPHRVEGPRLFMRAKGLGSESVSAVVGALSLDVLLLLFADLQYEVKKWCSAVDHANPMVTSSL